MPRFGLPPEDQVAFTVQRRLGSFPSYFIRDAPNATSAFTFSDNDTEVVKAIGRAIESLWPWLKSLNGPDGALIGARGVALQDPNAERRQARLAQIEQKAR
jgi:hypothetical protein